MKDKSIVKAFQIFSFYEEERMIYQKIMAPHKGVRLNIYTATKQIYC